MSTFKRVKMVILPTDQSSKLILMSNNKLSLAFSEMTNVRHGNNKQHLYFLSDEEIKESDWFYSSVSDTINQCESKYYAGKLIDPKRLKIIATTDSSLNLHDNSINNKCFGIQLSGKCSHLLPQPSVSFIEKYIEKYNKREQITEVIVEYESDYAEDDTECMGDEIEQLKVNPKDNTITIKPIKDSWNREEVIKFAEKFYNRFDFGFSTKIEYNSEDLKWIEQNL